MFDSNSPTRRLPFPAHTQARQRQAIERAADALHEGQRDADARRRKAVEGIRSEFLREVRSLLGESALTELRASTERERLDLRNLMQPPAGFGVDEPAAREAASRRLEAQLRVSGETRDQLARLRASVQGRLIEVLSEPDGPVSNGYHLEGNVDRWLARSPLHSSALSWGAVPPPDDPTSPNRWFLFKPPFFGFLFWFWYQGTDAFFPERDMFLEPPTGWVGNTVKLTSNDGGFAEVAQARADAQIAFAFEPPVPGILEVMVDAQCTAGTYDLRIRDNWGFSDGSAEQFNYLLITVLNPLGPEQLFVQMDHSHASTSGDDLTTQSNRLTRLQHYVGDVTTAGPVAGGEPVIIAVGTRSVDTGHVDRMDFQSTSDFRWLISSVEVRVVP